jgi:DNA-binding IclR family transcriptional regulator
MTIPNNTNRPVKTVERAIDIIEYLKQNESAPASEITDHLSCAKSTAHRHLKTLEANSFVIEEEDEYGLGLRFLDYGTVARDRYTLYQEAKPKVDNLAAETEEKFGVPSKSTVEASTFTRRRENAQSRRTPMSVTGTTSINTQRVKRS